MQMVKMAQLAEHEYAGVKCGIMDQFASMFGKAGHVIRLDCRSLEYGYVPFDMKGIKIVLLDTNVKHSLAASAYNERRTQGEAGVAKIQQHIPVILLFIYEIKKGAGFGYFNRSQLLNEN